MSIALIVTDRALDDLAFSLRQILPDVKVQQWPDIEQPDAVTLAVLWKHPSGITDQFPNLKAVISLGAGMDHIEADSAIDERYQQSRTMTLSLQQRMAQYVLAYVLQDWRNLDAYQRQQKQSSWQVLETNAVATVGFLGLGAMGKYVADRCLDLGFKTVAWTRQKTDKNHPCFHGQAGLKKVCQKSEYLVVLLPLNKDTHGLINQKTLAYCQPHTVLIQVGRGDCVNESELLDALNQGVIRHAVLDVFSEEPLADKHAFWSHPKVTVTPHISARSDNHQTAAAIADYYRRLS